MFETAFTTASSSAPIVLALVAVSLTVYYFYRRANRDTWKNYGIVCPKLPWNYFFTADFRGPISNLLNTYGDIVGVDDYHSLRLFTTNFELMRHVLIKDFNNFVDRGNSLTSRSDFAKSLFFGKGVEWKRQRQIVSPTFSSGKLRYISKTVNDSAHSLANFFLKSAQSGELVAIKKACSQFASEVIAKTAFGFQADFIGKDKSEFTEKTTKLIRQRSDFNAVLVTMLDRIPFLFKFGVYVLNMQYLDAVDLNTERYFEQILNQTIAERRKMQSAGQKTPVDFLELLLRANDAAAAGKLDTDDDHSYPQANGSRQPNAEVKTMSHEEVLGQSVLIIFAGMETTSTLLQYMMYSLAVNQDVQEKLFQEIQEKVTSENPSLDELNKLAYLEHVINETLRMYPPVPLIDRRAKETRTYDGVTIPKGATVMIPFFQIFNDPKLFPEPKKFNPDRFAPEEREKRDPMSFASFGYGPRLCPGMRLAYLEAKAAIVQTMRKVKFVLNEKTEPKPGEEVKFLKRGLLSPVKAFQLACEVREA